MSGARIGNQFGNYCRDLFRADYDTYFPGWERTYLVSEVGTNHGETMEFTNTSGATAQGVKQYAPMVEAATSTHYFYDDAQCKM